MVAITIMLTDDRASRLNETAKALGIKIPDSIMVQATKVIE